MKVKLRRLEEDNAKREKQIEELLDPTKVIFFHFLLFFFFLEIWTTDHTLQTFVSLQGSEYTRSFVDKKKEGSVVSLFSQVIKIPVVILFRSELTQIMFVYFCPSRFLMGWNRESWSWNSSVERKKMLWGETLPNFCISLCGLPVKLLKVWILYTPPNPHPLVNYKVSSGRPTWKSWRSL